MNLWISLIVTLILSLGALATAFSPLSVLPALILPYAAFGVFLAGFIYRIVTWAKAPGRKRTNFAPMPAFAHLPEGDLRAAAEFMLEMGQDNAEKPDDSKAPPPAKP